jgi:hypothetical protein
MTDGSKPLEDVTSAKGKLPVKGQLPSPDEEAFKSYMEKPTQDTGKTSPMAIEHPSPFQVGNPTYDSVKGQVHDTKNILTDMQQKMQTPGLVFKRSEQSLLNTKLSETNNYIRASAKKLGYEPPPLEIPAKAPPIAKFISYITDGQNQLVEVQNQLSTLSVRGELKPEQLLLIQVKLSQAQQELEYSSVLLAKTIDFLKQTMNIQI